MQELPHMSAYRLMQVLSSPFVAPLRFLAGQPVLFQSEHARLTIHMGQRRSERDHIVCENGIVLLCQDMLFFVAAPGGPVEYVAIPLRCITSETLHEPLFSKPHIAIKVHFNPSTAPTARKFKLALKDDSSLIFMTLLLSLLYRLRCIEAIGTHGVQRPIAMYSEPASLSPDSDHDTDLITPPRFSDRSSASAWSLQPSSPSHETCCSPSPGATRGPVAYLNPFTPSEIWVAEVGDPSDQTQVQHGCYCPKATPLLPRSSQPAVHEDVHEDRLRVFETTLRELKYWRLRFRMEYLLER